MSIDSRVSGGTRITDEQILAAAREVFLRDGADAPTSAVASQAGVSEALVFKRFGTRQQLVARALIPPEPRWYAMLVPDPPDPPATLLDVALVMLEELREHMPMSMLAWSRDPLDHWSKHPGEPPPVTGMKVLAAWFERQMRAGRMRRSDPEIVARVFSGAIVSHSMSEMTGLASRMPIATTTFARGLVDLVWNGIAPGP